MFKEATELAAWSNIPFASQREMIRAMQDPRYRSGRWADDRAYVEAVERKVSLSSRTGTNNTRSLDSVQKVDTELAAGLGNSETEATANRREREHDAEREMFETRGAMSVSPAARARIERQNSDPNSGYGFQKQEG